MHFLVLIKFDYNVLWIYLQKAEETEAREKVMAIVEQLLIEQWSWLPPVTTMNEQANTASNIMMAQLANQDNQWNIISKQSVL